MSPLQTLTALGDLVPALGAIVIALLVVSRCRGESRLIGVFGAVLIFIGIFIPTIAELADYSLYAISDFAAEQSRDHDETLDFVLSALPSLLQGLGLIAVAVSVIARASDIDAGAVDEYEPADGPTAAEEEK